MFLRYSPQNKKFTNIAVLTFLIPYLLLTLTVGGFHNGSFGASECEHTQPHVVEETTGAQIKHHEDARQHNPETCQICQWLKTSSLTCQFLTFETFAGITSTISAPTYAVISLTTIHKLTIRPPPNNLVFLLS
ncbi:hypothetical protein [Candidatus Kuenenia sp.]|uniref:hypothetical protein n=1 Tax=Candidatus Kuenenia sp. TaxID=2499824 RepID=UPI00321F8548